MVKNDDEKEKWRKRNADRKEYRKEYYLKNKDKISQAKKDWFLRNKETLKNRNEKWQADNPEKILLIGVKKRAKDKGIPFDIDAADIIIPDECPVFGVTLVRGKGKVCQNSPTIDRIIPELGYVKGNIQVISHLANAMKQNATKEQLIKFAEWVINEYKK